MDKKNVTLDYEERIEVLSLINQQLVKYKEWQDNADDQEDEEHWRRRAEALIKLKAKIV
jgi:hypothetical protein